MHLTPSNWTELPSGIYVPRPMERMVYNGHIVNLESLRDMDVGAFNDAARKFDVHIEGDDVPHTRMIRVQRYLARSQDVESFMPDFLQYTQIALDAAQQQERGTGTLYHLLTHFYGDATRDVIRFLDTERKGYRAALLRFNEQDVLETVADDIYLPKQGWIRTFNPIHGYPTETSSKREPVSHITLPLERVDKHGFWYVGKEPERGDERISIRDPVWRRGGLLRANVNEDRASSFELIGTIRMLQK